VVCQKQREPVAATPPPGVWPGPFSGVESAGPAATPTSVSS